MGPGGPFWESILKPLIFPTLLTSVVSEWCFYHSEVTEVPYLSKFLEILNVANISGFLRKDIKWRKSLILPTFSVSRMYFFELFFNLLVISVVSEWIYVNTEVTDISYLHQNDFFQKNLVKEHTEVPNLCGKSLILTTFTKISLKNQRVVCVTLHIFSRYLA